MNDEGRRLLTEYMGECWHEKGNRARFNPWMNTESWECKHCGNLYVENLTFDTGQDLYDLYRKMVEKGKWDDFYNWIALREDADYKEQVFTAWLFHVDRIPLIVAWLRKEKKP